MRALAVVLLLLSGCSSAPPPTAAPTAALPSVAPTLAPSSSSPSRPPSAQPSPVATASPTVLPTPRPTARLAFGDGTHLVPADVEPGTYRTVTYTEECYWTRLGGFESGLEDWLASGIGPGYHVVTIAADDKGFDSRDCTGWSDDLSAVTASRDAMGEGTYIVGTDIEPGSWTATTGANCYWARLSGFGGLEEEIVAQDLVTGVDAPVVTIAATDVGFTSNGCGEWRAIRH